MALVHKSPGVGILNRSGVSNPGPCLVEPQVSVAPTISLHELSVQLHPPVDTTSSGDQTVEPQDVVALASIGSGFFSKEKINEPKGFSLVKLRARVQEETHTDKFSRIFFNNIWRKMGCSTNSVNEEQYWIMMKGIAELELEHRTNPSRRLFSDLPAEILSQILGNLDPVSRLVCRNVSRSLRSIVDSEKPNIKCIELWEHSFGIQIRFSQPQRDVTFYRIEDDCLVYWRTNETIVEGDHYIRLALQCLKPILFNPKLKLVQFHAWLEDNSSVFQKLFDLMSDVVKTTNIQFHVEKLKPVLINHFLHFETFRVRLQSIPTNKVLRLMKILSTSAIFKRCDIEVLSDLDLNAIEEAFEMLPTNPVRQNGLLYVEVNYVQFSLRFWFDKSSFVIKRKSEEH
ncbi:hypothetical protein CAEBREN_21764 [Caenorhabditis brenneri]|uniref:F-box domain-containing protein n=1 Tax=Caenorhabditis brenneri TaxID=135651 RepID=G0P0M5_CAEBE|nr:hypothetical protein CAEBREN_21764 [Caenorhabditis brenneri]